jgi:hypothetical protein
VGTRGQEDSEGAVGTFVVERAIALMMELSRRRGSDNRLGEGKQNWSAR